MFSYIILLPLAAFLFVGIFLVLYFRKPGRGHGEQTERRDPPAA